jgi:hypothetical protein
MRSNRKRRAIGPEGRRRLALPLALGGLVALTLLATGCDSEDCVNCIPLPPPVVPTGVHSISGDNEIVVQWYDISYAPYDGQYNENVVSYRVYSRFFAEGDQNDPDRVFYLIGEVAWDENYDFLTGLHWFVDAGPDVVNGERYEYAVAAVNAAGAESALSYELVTDAPLPMSTVPVTIGDGSGFDFSTHLVVPGGAGDVLVTYRPAGTGMVPYLQATSADVRIQDFGVFTDANGGLIFEGVSWAPADGYSNTGILEIVAGHIYIVEIYDPVARTLHYAKLGITAVGFNAVQAHWAYQLIPGLPELAAPRERGVAEPEPVTLRL